MTTEHKAIVVVIDELFPSHRRNLQENIDLLVGPDLLQLQFVTNEKEVVEVIEKYRTDVAAVVFGWHARTLVAMVAEKTRARRIAFCEHKEQASELLGFGCTVECCPKSITQLSRILLQILSEFINTEPKLPLRAVE
jgi:hypothetical protein